MQSVIDVKNLVTRFGERIVHAGISLHVKEGEIYGIVGPSGCGKSTLLKEMAMLQDFTAGTINVLDFDLASISYDEAQELRQNIGFLFQKGALFSSLNVFENIALPLHEYTKLDKELIDEIVSYKIELVGLTQGDGLLYPSQISGGMTKKAALARALSLDPKLLFLDEPTSGLDPISAREFDSLILKLRDFLHLSIVMVSHDLQSLYATVDRLCVLDNGSVAAEGNMQEVTATATPFIQTFFAKEQEMGI
jgi:phospholipid/cholesterol/gamma-HCH transport system ATP-binding protein